MQDGIISGNGNSRYLKTVSAALGLYPTYEDFMAALIAGTFPIDLNGINTAGWTQQGTALNKANLFSDTTASALGLTASNTPNDALAKIKTLIDSANSNANSRVKMQIVSYVGTGVFGADNPCSIKANFPIKVAIMAGVAETGYNSQWRNFFSSTYTAFLCTDSMSTDFTKGYGFGANNGDNCYPMGKVSSDKKTLTWYSDGYSPSADNQFNHSNYTYYAILLG